VRAGVPSIITPVSADQPFWGNLISSLGVGPKPILRRALTSESLAGAITIAVNDKQMQEKAAALGRRIMEENGVTNAVKLIEDYAKARNA
jgi:UDP:flavonoid glycosyltransferase YjiC (YdhE family)